MPFFTQLKYAFNPASHKFLRKKTFSTFTFACKLLLLSFIIACLFYLPSATEWPTLMSWQLSHFNIGLSGNITTTTPVMFPITNPLIIIDTSGDRKTIGEEYVLVTNSFIEYRIIKQPQRWDFQGNDTAKTQIADFLAFMALFFFPAFLFWTYLIILIKYVIMATIVSLTAWLILDLSHFKQPLKQVFGSAFLSLVVVIPLEIISLPFSTNWMVPTSQIFLVNIYMLTTLLYLLMFTLSIIFSAVQDKKEYTENPQA